MLYLRFRGAADFYLLREGGAVACPLLELFSQGAGDRCRRGLKGVRNKWVYLLTVPVRDFQIDWRLERKSNQNNRALSNHEFHVINRNVDLRRSSQRSEVVCRANDRRLFRIQFSNFLHKTQHCLCYIGNDVFSRHLRSLEKFFGIINRFVFAPNIFWWATVKIHCVSISDQIIAALIAAWAKFSYDYKSLACSNKWMRFHPRASNNPFARDRRHGTGHIHKTPSEKIRRSRIPVLQVPLRSPLEPMSSKSRRNFLSWLENHTLKLL